MSPSESTARGAFRACRRVVAETKARGRAIEHSYRLYYKCPSKDLGGATPCVPSTKLRTLPAAHRISSSPEAVPIGHVECKDIGSGLDWVESDAQLKRDRAVLPSFTLTDYLEIRCCAYHEFREMARVGRIDSPGGAKRRRRSALPQARPVRSEGMM